VARQGDHPMSTESQPRLSQPAKAFVAAITVTGFALVAFSIADLIQQRSSPEFAYHNFAWLAFLTLLSGFVPVKLPKVHANISVSETFIFCGTLLFGPSTGALLVFFDVALIWVKLARQQVVWHRMLFSMAANPLSIWVAAFVFFQVSGTGPLAGIPMQPPSLRFIAGLSAFAILYFFLNSSILAVAIALDQGLNPYTIWSKHFSRLWMNYWAGASVAGLLVSITREVSLLSLVLIAPLLLVLFLTYRWSTERVEKAEKHLAEMKRTFLQTIEALALAIDAKDQVTHGHIRRVQRFTMALAEALGVKDESLLDALRAAALLHDTGKLAVPEYILNKPGPLTASEFERMKLHASVGADILKSIDFPYPVEPIVRHHHENWDGTGYPAGLKGQSIPLGARILAVVDCYDALTSDRPYRPRYSRQYSEQVLRERRGAMYDPWIVDTFLEILDRLGLDSDVPNATAGQADGIRSEQLEVINATTAEDREFNELRRELPKATTTHDAAHVIFHHLRRVVPASSFALYIVKTESNELAPEACDGVGAGVIEGLRIPMGDRISGWAAAHKQVVVNSNAALELGPVARTFSTPLRYALAVPVAASAAGAISVLTIYGSEPFDSDHRRIVESAATLLSSALCNRTNQDPLPAGRRGSETAASRIH
jgi:putative nucleotidyltransferase with HDIG domain